MKKLIFQRIVQGLSILVGIFGAIMIVAFTLIAYKPLQEGNVSLLLFSLVGALFGIAMIWAGYQSVTNYSLASIKSLSTVLTISVFGQVIRYIEPQLRVLMESGETELMLVSGITPLIALVLCYLALVTVIKKLTVDVNET